MFYNGRVMYCLYKDNSIIVGLFTKVIDIIILWMKQVKLYITVEGTIEDFLGVNVGEKKDRTIHPTQPYVG